MSALKIFGCAGGVRPINFEFYSADGGVQPPLDPGEDAFQGAMRSRIGVLVSVTADTFNELIVLYS